jgi:tetratricopeptide (TPR) repeat protein
MNDTADNAIPLLLLGSDYAAEGEIDKAETALAQAVLLSPALHIARYQLGLLQFSSGRAAAALVTWGPLLALDPTEALGHFVRGFASLSQDDFAPAQVHFEAGLACSHGNPALAGDIQMVMARVRELQAQGPVGDSGPAPEESPAAHVLLTNYGKFGTLH